MKNAPGFYSTNPGRWTVRRAGKVWSVESDVGTMVHAVWGVRSTFAEAKKFAAALSEVHDRRLGCSDTHDDDCYACEIGDCGNDGACGATHTCERPSLSNSVEET